MSDYQAIYDAVRSRISGGNVSEAVSEAVRQAFDISYVLPRVLEAVDIVNHEMTRPSVLFNPRVYQDGNSWLAIYGDLPTGVVGTGSSPAEACENFDRAWIKAQEPSP